MKNIGIITITGGSNYGNRLQNYALQHYIEKKFECTIETLKNESQTLSSIIKKFLVKEQETKKAQRFKEFNKKYINFSKLSINNFTKSKDILDYDVLICGSDQIWNSSFRENDRANFGYFYPQQFVISYAASFGTEKVDSTKKRKYKKYLKHLKYISVREDSGKKIVKELTNNDDVEVLVDPTMLLTSNEWDKIAKKPKQLKEEKYILCYFLGDINAKDKQVIETFAKKYNYKIIDIMNPKSEYANCNPNEFLYLEKNAYMICTDSFHSAIFAILYQRPFFVFNRNYGKLKNMSSRLETLLTKFALENRKFSGKITEENLKCDYAKTYMILEKERLKSYNFLKKALPIKERRNHEQ